MQTINDRELSFEELSSVSGGDFKHHFKEIKVSIRVSADGIRQSWVDKNGEVQEIHIKTK